MILETLRTLTDWWNGATYGANAKIAALVVDAGDVVPTIQLIVDETRNGIVARNGVPAGYDRMLLVRSEPLSAVDAEVQTYIRNAQITVAAQYYVRNVATEVGIQNWLYTQRALLQSLKNLESTAAGEVARVRNGIHIFAVTSVEGATQYEPLADSVLTGGLRITFQLRDTLA